MSSVRVSRIHRGLIAALVTTYLGAGIAGFFIDFNRASDQVIWMVLLIGGAVLIVLGAVLRARPLWLSPVLVSIGAIAGGVALVWTIVVPIAVAVLIAMSFSLARRPETA